MKHYTLNHFGGNRFALANETDRDTMTDYFPGIWGIPSQKQALANCRALVAEGHTITPGFGSDTAVVNRILSKI